MKAHSSRIPTLARIVLPVLLTAACGKEPAPAAAAPEAKGDAAPAATTGAPAAGVASLTGTVLETMDAAGYTYMKLKTADGETWAAVNESKVAVGDAVTVLNPMPMDGFESSTLKRKFDRIVFGSLGPSSAAAPAAAGPGGAGMATTHGGAAVPEAVAAQHAGVSGGGEPAEKVSVAKAEGPDGRTIAELFAQRASLKGKAVSVRGKVVKYNGGILGKNWIHLRDGSGTAEGKDNDLAVTTSDVVAKGDVVLVKGTVALDRDFGSGYTYVLLVEDAKVTK